MKKIIALVLVLALAISMVFAIAGCKETEEVFKVGVIHIGDPADGTGYSYAHDMGIQAMQEELGITDEYVVRKLNVDDGDSAAIRTAVEDCIAKGCKIIFGTSFGYQDSMAELAPDYPNVIFAHGTGYMHNDINMSNYFGRIYQARYLAGIAAGLKTQTNKLGYVAAYGTELAETCSGINAFALGAMAVNPDAEVYVKVMNSWFDPANETAFANALIDLDCDVIAQHCDTANPQIAAETAGVWGCGYNSDMTAAAPEAHLTAPIWNWGVYYTEATRAAQVGVSHFMEEMTNNWFGGLAEGFVDVSPLTDNCAAGTASAISQVKTMMIDGDFDVFEGRKLTITIEDGVATVVASDYAMGDLIKNHSYADDLTVAAGDPYVGDGVIQGTMNCYVENVTEQ